MNGFVKVEEYATTNCPEYLSFLAYVEEYYIGLIDKKTNQRKQPRFDISTWNVHDRIINNKPRTSNKIERFNKEFAVDTGSYHLATNDLIENLRLEQGHTESVIVKINLGKENPQHILYQELDKAYVNLVKSYDKEDFLAFLINISRVIDNFNEKINKNRKRIIDNSSSDENDH